MTEAELEPVILNIIKEEYCHEYTGYLHIDLLNPGYKVVLGLNNKDKPLSIAADLDDEAFLKFFRQEIRDRNLYYTQYFTGYKIDPYHELLNNTCECNENR